MVVDACNSMLKRTDALVTSRPCLCLSSAFLVFYLVVIFHLFFKNRAFPETFSEIADIYTNFNIEFGNLEGDTIVGEKHKSAFVTLVERLSKAIITLKK